MSQVLKIGLVKAGCIGTLPLIEFLLDERAERTDINVTVAGSGAKLGVEQCKVAVNQTINQKPHLVIFIGPAQEKPGPREARKLLTEARIPTIIISDSSTKRIVEELNDSGFGYIVVDQDSMIGARREFLDPIEMALYNSDVIRVLSITGAFRVIIEELEGVIKSMKEKRQTQLPRIIIDRETAIETAGFTNPYAKAKAIAAYEISKNVAELNAEACFKVKEWTKYVPLAAAGHEMMSVAARLSDEARSIEKSIDSVLRKPHYKNGQLGTKRILIEKPSKD